MIRDVVSQYCGVPLSTSDMAVSNSLAYPSVEVSTTETLPETTSTSDMAASEPSNDESSAAVATDCVKEASHHEEASSYSEACDEAPCPEVQQQSSVSSAGAELPHTKGSRQEEPNVSDNNAEANPSTTSDQTAQMSSGTSEGTPSNSSEQPLTREQIRAAVLQQVEYFFSRDYWCRDSYLISQMDSDQYVPVFILANCSQFKSITKDHSIILEALRESLYVQLDEEKNRVRPNYNRCIVILREIPESTSPQEVRDMFLGEKSPKVVDCEFVHNGSWYITFENDQDAHKAYYYLREVVRTFRGKPIRARIKTKPMSSLRCPSVLHSYAGKPPPGSNEPVPTSVQGQVPVSQVPVPPGTPGVSTVPPAPSYHPGGQSQIYYSTQPTSVAHSTYYSPPNSHLAPSNAVFYPHMPSLFAPWAVTAAAASPHGICDLSSFFSFNGLAPQATYKPPFRSATNPQQPNGNIGASTSGNNANSNSSKRNVRNSRPNGVANGPNKMRSQVTSAPQYIPQASGTSVQLANNFAQSDSLAHVSQSSLYMSFSPPTQPKPNKTVTPTSSSSSTPCSATPPPQAPPQNVMVNGHVEEPPVSQVMASVAQTSFTYGAAVQQVVAPLPPAPHRGPELNQYQKDARLPFRGGRRKPRGSEDVISSNGSRFAPPHRPQATSVESIGTASYSAEVKQFDLEDSAFPPLPGSDEATAPTEKPAESPSTPWGVDSQKFSDVMKGTAKARPSPPGSSVEEPAPPVSLEPESFSTVSDPVDVTVTTSSTSHSIVTDSSSHVTKSVESSEVVSATVTSAPVVATPTPVPTQPTPVAKSEQPLPQRPLTQRYQRDDRRVQRGRDGGYANRGRREGASFRGGISGGNKENRPVAFRHPREDNRPDGEGWVTRTRDQRHFKHDYRNSYSHKYFEQSQVHNEKETKGSLVNGDSTPPPSPKLEKIEKKVEEIAVSTSPVVNNHGEQKPSYAKIAWESKDDMQKLSAELKEKDEQKLRRKKTTINNTKPERGNTFREAKPIGKEGFAPREMQRYPPEDRGSGASPPSSPPPQPKSPK